MIRSLENAALLLWDATLRMGGYFVLAVLLAALIKTFKLDKRIRRLLAGAGSWSVPLATAAGLVSPLCSCGILPVVVSLVEAGVPAAPLMALLITSPVMSPDALVLTWGTLGPEFALAKLGGAAALGLAMGWLTHRLIARGVLPENPFRPAAVSARHHCVDSGDPDDPRRGLTVTISRWRYFALMVKDMVWIIGRFLALALVLQAMLMAFVPANAVKVLVGRPTPISLLLAAAVGLPLPLHQVAVVPILRGLLDLGVNRGAAVVLLMLGPVASVPALVFLWGMVDRRLFWTYLAVGVSGSLVLGGLFLL